MDGYLNDRTIGERWIIPKELLSQETTARFSWEVQYTSIIRARYPHLLDTLNFENYVSTGSHLIRVTNNPYYKLDKEDKARFLNTWIDRISMIAQPVVNIILNFSKLKDNWDSYDAEKISLPTVLNAISFFMRIIDLHPNAPLPFIAPVPDGSIHFEWNTCSSELRHIVPKAESACYFYKIIEKGSGELKQYSNSIYGVDEMINIFSQWMEGSY